MSCADGTWLCWLYNWQTLIAGLIGGGAAILVIAFTLLAERRRRYEEIHYLKAALGAEIRITMHWMLQIHLELVDRMEDDGRQTPGWELQQIIRPEQPVIYPSVTSQIGAFGPRAVDVLVFYRGLESFQRMVLSGLRTDANGPSVTLARLAVAAGYMLFLLQRGAPLLEMLHFGKLDRRDRNLRARIAAAAENWEPYAEVYSDEIAQARRMSKTRSDFDK